MPNIAYKYTCMRNSTAAIIIQRNRIHIPLPISTMITYIVLPKKILQKEEGFFSASQYPFQREEGTSVERNLEDKEIQKFP